jgi:alpha-beta hydrolase superfamily lysophospholipase
MFGKLMLVVGILQPFLTLSGSVTSALDSCDSQTGTCRVYTILGKPAEYTNSSVGVKLAVRRWIPHDVKSVVVFVHGGAGFHSGYADIMGQSLKGAGIAVIAYDSVGSGYSDGMNGGLRNYVDSMDTLANDFTKVLKGVRAEYPSCKVFALGESFGCMVLLAQILKEQKNAGQENGPSLADGYVLTGPVVKVLP